MNPYESCPMFGEETITLRKIKRQDCDALLKCYSDRAAQPLFNADNCDDDFRYDTKEKMSAAVEFWLEAYEKQWFVRWSVIDNASGEAVGTIEMCRRDDNDGILRIDLRSDCETEEIAAEILNVACNYFYSMFEVKSIYTKCVPQAKKRLIAVTNHGFVPVNGKLHYYVKTK